MVSRLMMPISSPLIAATRSGVVPVRVRRSGSAPCARSAVRHVSRSATSPRGWGTGRRSRRGARVGALLEQRRGDVAALLAHCDE